MFSTAIDIEQLLLKMSISTITDSGIKQLDNWEIDIEKRILYLKCFLDRYENLKR